MHYFEQYYYGREGSERINRIGQAFSIHVSIVDTTKYNTSQIV